MEPPCPPRSACSPNSPTAVRSGVLIVRILWRSTSVPTNSIRRHGRGSFAKRRRLAFCRYTCRGESRRRGATCRRLFKPDCRSCLLHRSFPVTAKLFVAPKKPGPRGPGFSDCRRGGRQCLPEGNMLPCRRFWEDIHPAKQRTTSMRSVLHSGNVGRRMTAMRNRNSSESDDFHHLVSRLAKILLHNFGGNLRSASAGRSRPGNLEKPEYVRPI